MILHIRETLFELISGFLVHGFHLLNTLPQFLKLWMLGVPSSWETAKHLAYANPPDGEVLYVCTSHMWDGFALNSALIVNAYS